MPNESCKRCARHDRTSSCAVGAIGAATLVASLAIEVGYSDSWALVLAGVGALTGFLIGLASSQEKKEVSNER